MLQPKQPLRHVPSKLQASAADTWQPGAQVDASITFDQVGGLQSYVAQLKEMIFLPLVYPELFQRFHITPPRGVLFHGPPGKC